MRDTLVTYRFPAICCTLMLVVFSNLAQAEYREQWLGTPISNAKWASIARNVARMVKLCEPQYGDAQFGRG
ncbi:hypothetical protein DPV79_15680 [Burkholderia reimsis]|uniref:Uncharacterized protein n=1 Tax=Burkholderia reimsis TaxID=2234132 RepID=A0A365QVJ0_9BURK|nr:hypothetical protein DPV79_15680 [Burkholderia reimsis]